MKIDIAYGGSCTGGKKADMDMYARVLGDAVDKGKRVAPGVHFYLQFGSQDIRRYAEEKGYLEVFEKAGAELVDPSCGACIKAGPGSSDSPDQVTVSAQNRNFPGRSGPGKVYLASPLVVAASAIAGKIVLPEQIEDGRTMSRSYSRDEAQAILARAVERQHGAGDQLTHEELLGIARELGVSGEAFEAAAAGIGDHVVIEREVNLRVMRARRGFLFHLVPFLLVNLLLVTINVMTTSFLAVFLPAARLGRRPG